MCFYVDYGELSVALVRVCIRSFVVFHHIVLPSQTAEGGGSLWLFCVSVSLLVNYVCVSLSVCEITGSMSHDGKADRQVKYDFS